MYMFHAAVQCALNLEPSGQEMCPRTVQRYEKLFVEEETACLVMTEVTGRLREELDLEVKQQRLDSPPRAQFAQAQSPRLHALPFFFPTHTLTLAPYLCTMCGTNSTR